MMVNGRDTLKAALELWGPVAQTMMVFEEMSELQKELCKNARGRDNTDAIAEEIADVKIMLEQMIILHDCADKVQEHTTAKMIRLAERVEASRAAHRGMTNADVIRSMSEDELVEGLFRQYRATVNFAESEDLSAKWCDMGGGCLVDGEDIECDEEKHRDCIRRWLRKEAETDGK